MAEKGSCSSNINGSDQTAWSSKSNGDLAIAASKLSDQLPLKLIKSEIVPPSANRSHSTADWLPDFAGFSWIAYGASSLLVISHFPSSLSEEEVFIGPIFRQVIELSTNDSAVVKAVAWSPAVPSEGDVAVALENCVCLCSESSGRVLGSFCWSLCAVLVQSNAIAALTWTGSGDGIITAGSDIVIWKKDNRTWEIAWKCAVEWPQTLVSATWSTEGPVATAVYSVGSSLGSDKGRCVLVCQNDGKSGLIKSELHHPRPVSMIQWRPSTRTLSQRAVLLTCCLDGTVRLWSEIDGWRGKRFGKETNDQKGLNRSFHVISVIEVNQLLNGVLGTNIFVTWAVEFGGLIDADESSVSEMPGRCEWLIGFGPGISFTFWAIHCLDDISPLRFPRVTLWKKQQFAGLQCAGSLDSKLESFDIKTVISRSRLYGPPPVCSLFRFSSDNSMRWLQYTTRTNSVKDGFLSTDGHIGSILQVAFHPYSYEVGLAASLDSNGLLLLWSFSTVSNSILGMPMMAHPTWKLLGKTVSRDVSFVKYSSVAWAPLVLNNYNVLLMGHTEGVDCFIVKQLNSKEEKVLWHKLCTIPLTDHSCGSGPTNISSFPLPSTCEKISISNKFMLLGVWMNDFQALSWEVSVHFDNLSGSSCGCSCDLGGVRDYGTKRYRSSFAGSSYSVSASPCSSEFPNPCKKDQVTSAAVVSPGNLMSSVQQNEASINGFCCNIAPYHMATGFFDGSIKLWKSTCLSSKNSHSEMAFVPWKLVGVFQAHDGPISLISFSSCGQKIATISTDRNVSTLRIWETMHVLDVGAFLLADNISFGNVVTALSWLTTGDGQLLLGVSTGNEVLVYARRRFSFQNLANLENPSGSHLWFCIASCHTSPSVHDFLWGPGATPVLVHERYFSLLSRWSFCMDRKRQPKYHSENAEDNSPHSLAGTENGMVFAVFPDPKTCDIKEFQTIGKSKEWEPSLPTKINIRNGDQINNLFSTVSQQQYNSSLETCCWSILELAEKLCGSLSVYHPEALLLNLYSGNWRRACVSVQHLVESLVSDLHVTCDKGGDYAGQRPSNIIPQIALPKLFDEHSSMGLGDKVLQWGRDAALVGYVGQLPENFIQSARYNSVANGSNYFFNSTATKSELSTIIETLEKCHDITGINSMEKTQMLAVIDVLDEITDSRSASIYESLDAPGRRFWVAIRFKLLYSLRRFGRLITMEELVVDSELMGWAYHSDCQENLFNSILSKEPTWREMRNLGVGYWFTNPTELRTRMEKLARSQYLKNKDPKDCALLYIALNRIQVLAGLFKISKDEKDKPLVGFLSRNFQEEKNKAAALKNAYVLMGRHQLELAAAFFLLGGDPSSAVTVCAKNLGDEQLALVICRLVEGCGGPLECQLISKVLLPSAIEKGDYWLVSLLEWAMGNYSQSFLKLLGFQLDSLIEKSVLSSNLAAFSDPKVGQYCTMLATKNHMKNSVGEHAAAALIRLATIMTSTALNRCGLPLEALEVLSSSVSAVEGRDQASTLGMNHGIFHEILKTSQTDFLNWLSVDVALHLESNKKFDLASQYISKLIKEHPNWPDTMLSFCGMFSEEDEASYHKQLLENCQQKLQLGLTTFERKYSISSVGLMSMILVFSCNNGVTFHGYHVLHGYISREYSQDTNHAFDSILQSSPLPELFLKALGEFACFIACYVVACGTTFYPPTPSFPSLVVSENNSSGHLNAFNLHLKGLVCLVKSLRDMLKIYCPGFLPEDLYMKALTAFELIEYYMFFASMWLQRNMRDLILLMHPIFIKRERDIPPGINFTEPELVFHKTKLMIYRSLGASVEGFPVATCNQLPNERSSQLDIPIPDGERWLLIGACIWTKLSYFNRDQLKSMPDIAEDNCPSRLPRISSLTCSYEAFASDRNVAVRAFEELSVFLEKLLRSIFACISSSLAKQLESFFRKKVESQCSDGFLVWLEAFIKSQPRALYKHLEQENGDLSMIIDENSSSLLAILWEISTYPEEIREGLLLEKLQCLQSICQKSCKGWRYLHKSIMNEVENGDNTNNKHASNVGSMSPKFQAVTSSGRGSNESHSSVGSRQKNSTVTTEVTCFENPEVICKRNGELLEVMCINSIDQRQAALASNRKGIVYFTWKDDEQSENHSDFVWSEADWPRDGWAGSESTPIPTPVSPGIGLGSKKGAHLGLGGATIGTSFARPGRDLTGGGAFGIPGYAGIGASSLGWGTQEDFEEFVDPPATVENIHTRALSSHPSRPFFLVGSSNTHAYLWEFGKEKATATYGMLPAANVPPPYALASISALQFDHCGHRFATAALDGTVCTWQLEVGGRNNIPPTESSLCFNSHASDITYVAASGSVIAAAGHSANDVNVVIWDTLAPPTSSQASLMCHQGGARSISVFDNDIGSGSISPLIVTGGTGGDVGLHDFRFIATGKTKHHRHSNLSKENIKCSSTYDAQSGNSHKVGEVPKGMLWYIPKAHLGSVTRIATIPHTSFFLTGSKDGDVKLWDAARAKLLFHWPKLHERHTFLQPSSRGFGGVVRAAVTDIQVLSHGFLTCGGDGTVKLVKFSGFQP